MAQTERSIDCDALFRQYVEVCNRAMAEHAEEFPYKQIWNAARKAIGENGVRIAVYDDQPKSAYEIHLEGDHLEASRDGHSDSPVWRMDLSYLQEVVEHPEAYIQNPARLDWDWLRSRTKD